MSCALLFHWMLLHCLLCLSVSHCSICFISSSSQTVAHVLHLVIASTELTSCLTVSFLSTFTLFHHLAHSATQTAQLAKSATHLSKWSHFGKLLVGEIVMCWFDTECAFLVFLSIQGIQEVWKQNRHNQFLPTPLQFTIHNHLLVWTCSIHQNVYIN
jgi:hypothetical protein